MVYSWGRGWIKKNVLWSTHVVDLLSFSMFPLILTFDFDLYLGSFFTLLGSNGLFLELG